MGSWVLWMLVPAASVWSGYTLGHWHGWKKGYDACYRILGEKKEGEVDAEGN